jgi:putative ABC transport system substrate-binding protein
MRRRAFIKLLGGVATSWPLKAWSQQPATQRRIAIFHPAIPTTLLTETGGGTAWAAFFAELRRLGYIEGGNLIIERYSAEGHHERYAELAREIVARKPDVIVTGTNPVVITFKAASGTIPVVAFMLDPLKAGLVTSLARPGGNLTGITLDAGTEIWGKRLQMLKEAIPSAAKAAFLAMREGWEGSSGQVLRDAAGRLGISLVFVLPPKGTPSELERVFAELEQQRPDAVLVSGEGDLYAHRQLIDDDRHDDAFGRAHAPDLCARRPGGGATGKAIGGERLFCRRGRRLRTPACDSARHRGGSFSATADFVPMRGARLRSVPATALIASAAAGP